MCCILSGKDGWDRVDSGIPFQHQFSDTNWVISFSTDATSEELSPTDGPHLRPQVSPSNPHFRLTDYRCRGSHDPLGSEFARTHHRTQESSIPVITFLLQMIPMNSQLKRFLEQQDGGWEGAGASIPVESARQYVHHPGVSLFPVFIESSLHKHD